MLPIRVFPLLLLAGILATAPLPGAPAWAKSIPGVSSTGEALAPAPGTGGFLEHKSSSGTAAKTTKRSSAPPAVRAVPVGPAVQSESLDTPTAPRDTVSTAAPTVSSQALPYQAAPRVSFVSGLTGGLLGAGLGSFLMGAGHPFFGQGGGGFAGAMIQLGLLFLIGRWLLRKALGNRLTPVPSSGYRRNGFPREPGFEPDFEPGFREPTLGTPGSSGPMEPRLGKARFDEPRLSAPLRDEPEAFIPQRGVLSRTPAQRTEPRLGAAERAEPSLDRATANPPPVNPQPANRLQFVLSDQDLAALETLLIHVQKAWSNGDDNALRRLATPEMATRFSSQLAEDRARGLENRVERVQLLKGDVSESWHEDGMEHVRATLYWSALDYTLSHAGRGAAGDVVAGDPDNPVEMAEVWTVLRHAGAPWILSAIQQI